MGEVDSSFFFSCAKILKVKIHSLDLHDSEFDAAWWEFFFFSTWGNPFHLRCGGITFFRLTINKRILVLNPLFKCSVLNCQSLIESFYSVWLHSDCKLKIERLTKKGEKDEQQEKRNVERSSGWFSVGWIYCSSFMVQTLVFVCVLVLLWRIMFFRPLKCWTVGHVQLDVQPFNACIYL